ncbi:unnamed protein product [Dibothriocephalus latus]|uniref:Uncharacterized protein n=1 Tax=Dibothriocephalus latus TaxID=60516 RepID=A0A3P7M1S5_DIBLA|nr:unnamed protein product [Dibothriocephalus latus]
MVDFFTKMAEPVPLPDTSVIKAFLHRHPPATWDDALSAYLLAYRSTVNATTHYTPFFLTCGRDRQLPEDLVFHLSRQAEHVDTYALRAH